MHIAPTQPLEMPHVTTIKPSRKQRQAEGRRRAQVRRAEARRLEAQRAEARAEELAPAVVRKPVYRIQADPTTGEIIATMLRGPLVEVHGATIQHTEVVAHLVGQRGELEPSHLDVIGNLVARGQGQIVTKRHLQAARDLQRDFREVGEGIGLGASDYGRVQGGADGHDGKHQALMQQVRARDRLEGALAALGVLRGVVVAIVLDCVPVSVWARQNGMGDRHAVGFLAAGLTVLAAFYSPESGKPRPIRAARVENSV